MFCNLPEFWVLRSDIKIIRRQIRYNRIRRFVPPKAVFLLAFRYRNISVAGLKLGYRRSYFWFNRLKEANLDIESLEERSRRPVSHPKKTPREIVDKIVSLQKQNNYRPDRLHYPLEQLYNIHLPKSTIGRVLKKENLIPPERLKHKKKHTKRYQMPNPEDNVQADVKYVPYRIHAQQQYQYTAIDDPASGGGGDSLKFIMISPSITPKTSLKNL